MRVNVYAEEFVRVERGIKTIEGGRTMLWVRIVLKAHPSMVPPEHRDDDSPAVTFWFDNIVDLKKFTAAVADR